MEYHPCGTNMSTSDSRGVLRWQLHWIARWSDYNGRILTERDRYCKVGGLYFRTQYIPQADARLDQFRFKVLIDFVS